MGWAVRSADAQPLPPSPRRASRMHAHAYESSDAAPRGRWVRSVGTGWLGQVSGGFWWYGATWRDRTGSGGPVLMADGVKRTLRPVPPSSPGSPGAPHSVTAVPDRCSTRPLPKPANSRAAVGSTARLPRLLNILLPG